MTLSDAKADRTGMAQIARCRRARRAEDDVFTTEGVEHNVPRPRFAATRFLKSAHS
jgi:hypothetical protein